MSVKSKPATCSQAEASKSWETTAVTVGARGTPLDGDAVRRDRRPYRERESAGPAASAPLQLRRRSRLRRGCGQLRWSGRSRPRAEKAALGELTEGSGCEHGGRAPLDAARAPHGGGAAGGGRPARRPVSRVAQRPAGL